MAFSSTSKSKRTAAGILGSLLISALVIFPALSAMRLFHNFKMVTIFSAVLSVLCALSGIVISILAGTPVGSTIVSVYHDESTDKYYFACIIKDATLRNARLLR